MTTCYTLAASALVFGLAYLFLISYFIRQWQRLPAASLPDGQPETPVSISVLVPARNEAANIEACLNALRRQRYPASAYEVIVIDDYSTDHTPDIVERIRQPELHLIRLARLLPQEPGGAHKKKALETGVAHARGTLIVTTDADCIAPPDWLAHMAAFYQKHDAAFIAGPVGFHREKNDLCFFQSLDFLGTMLLTGAGIRAGWMHLANGANLAFPKAIFEEVEGYAGVDHLASGDDMLLLHKIAKRYPRRIGFLKSPAALVLTEAKPDWRSFFRQRLRWASKSDAYSEKQVTAVLALVFLLCWAILLSPLLFFFHPLSAVLVFSILAGAKSLADFRLLSEASRFFQRPELMRRFWTSQLFHVLYIASVGLMANFVKEYNWKGRRVR